MDQQARVQSDPLPVLQTCRWWRVHLLWNGQSGNSQMLRCLTSDVSSVTHIMNCNLLPGLPKFREGMTECHLTPQEYGKYQGCVNWNMFYTNCNTGPHNPFHGAVSFDNIGLAWVAIFLVIFFIYNTQFSLCLVKVISLEGWTDVMYIIQDTHSFYNFIYFVVLIIVSFA